MRATEIKFNRVLVVSHNSFSDRQNNGKTLGAFFHGWDKEKLAQIYLTTDVPSFSVCERFFQLTDFDVLRRLFDFRHDGRVVLADSVNALSDVKSEVQKSWVVGFVRNRIGPFFRFSRDLLWGIAGFKTKKIKEFIEDFNPEVVFFQSSSGVFAFQLVKWICRKYNLPLVVQTTDDYLSPKKTLNPFFWIQYFRLVAIYKWAAMYAGSIIAISDDMKDEYSSRFGGNYHVAMNAFELSHVGVRKNQTNEVRFLYAGNLGLNRWRVLAEIGESLSDIYKEHGVRGFLSIYSLIDPGPSVVSRLNCDGFSSFMGAVGPDDLQKIRANSDVLVHVESFDKNDIFITRLSISTKIPEYLASGRCIYAVGPGNVASIKYIIKNNLGFCTDDYRRDRIKKDLLDIVLSPERRKYYADIGQLVAKTRHNPIETSRLVNELLALAVSAKA